MGEVYNRRRYLTAYAKQQDTEFGDILIDRGGGDVDDYSGWFPFPIIWSRWAMKVLATVTSRSMRPVSILLCVSVILLG